jgi:hypothetical protein
MSLSIQKRELLILDLDEWHPLDARQMPTVCLLLADFEISALAISNIVQDLLSAGCTYFMTWGAHSEDAENKIDEIIESMGDEYLSVVTSSHNGEPCEDVAWFFVNATIPQEHSLRWVVCYKKSSDVLDALLKSVKQAIKNQSC